MKQELELIYRLTLIHKMSINIKRSVSNPNCYRLDWAHPNLFPGSRTAVYLGPPDMTQPECAWLNDYERTS